MCNQTLDSKDKFDLPARSVLDFQKKIQLTHLFWSAHLWVLKKCLSACLFWYGCILGTLGYMIDYQITNMANTFFA